MPPSEGLARPPQADDAPPGAAPLGAAGVPAVPAVASVTAVPAAPVAPVAAASAVAQALPVAAAAAATLALYAQVLDASTLSAAVHRLVAALAQSEGLTRVAFGLHQHQRTRVLALSHADLADAPADLLQALQGAMDEAIDQALPVAWPVLDLQRRGGVAELIRLEHQALARLWGGVGGAGGAVASVPLGQGGAVLGAVCLQREAGPPFTPRELARLAAQLQLATPALRWMQQAAAPWHQRVWDDLQRARHSLRQPERRVLRLGLIVAGLALAGLALVPLPQSVSGRARIEGGQQRVVVAPADGFVKVAHVRPGDQVRAGAPLLDLLEQDLQLEKDKWTSQLAQHENAYAAAMARSERLAAATAAARISEAQSQLALVAGQLQRGRLVAPFDALVIQGDLSQAMGAPVRQGDTLLTLASTGTHRVIVDIDETDIAAVRPGQAGALALSSLPWQGQTLVVERIAPLARAVDGRNVFEVEARLAAPRDGQQPGHLRPGLLGRAELVVGQAPPLLVWLGQAANRLRLAWWAWLG
jgi:multidrug efflux pump subunit AcrA (membrane-fusion protein)